MRDEEKKHIEIRKSGGACLIAERGGDPGGG